MSLTVTESQAVFDVLGWLAGSPEPGFTAIEAVDAMEVLEAGAYKRMLCRPGGDLPARIVERLAAADSDGAAQAVCRAIEAHCAKGGGIPWPAIRSPFAEWQAARRDAAGAGEWVHE